MIPSAELSFVRRLIRFFSTIMLTAGLLSATVMASDSQQPVKRIGFFEAGDYAWHGLLRSSFMNELESLAEGSYRVIFPAEGYNNAGWNRDSCRAVAQRLAAAQSVDVLIAFGPWVVEDLLAAGYEGPVVALHRFDPMLEGLVDSGGRPVASNLTVSLASNRYKKDITSLIRLIGVQRLGVLLFPSGDERPDLLNRLQQSADEFGVEIISAEGYAPDGRYAFFKAYGELDKSVDAVYVGPMWGMTPVMMRQFFEACRRDRLPVFSGEGRFHVTRGAFAANAGQTAVSEALLGAWKTLQILNGTSPVELPVAWAAPAGLAINEQTAQACEIELPLFLRMMAEIEPDPTCEACEYFTSGRALDQALSANPGLQAAQAALRRAEDLAAAAKGEYLPQIDVSASARWVDPNTVHNSLREESRDQFGASIQLEQTVFSRAVYNRIKNARLSAEQAGIQTEAVRLNLEAAVLLAYVNLMHARSQVDLEVNVRRFIDRFLEHASARVPLGLSSTEEELRWRSAWHEAVSRIETARDNAETAEAMLQSLLYLPSETGLLLDTQWFAMAGLTGDFVRIRVDRLTPSHLETISEAFATEALAGSRELAVRESSIAIGRLSVSEARSVWVPQIGFQAELGWYDRLAAQPGEFEEKTPVWSLGATLNWPLFAGGANWKRLSAAREHESVLQNEQDEEARLTASRAGALAASLLTSLRNSVALADAAQTADAYLRLLAENARDPLTEQLDAVQLYRRAVRASLQNRAEYHMTAIEACRLFGWSIAERNSTPAAELNALIQRLGASGR